MDIIIGAGATGLAYASFTSNDYLILEADSEIGGYCKTICRDGFVWDYSGHFFHFRSPEMERWICANIDPALILKVDKHTQINYYGTYIDFPFQKNIHQLPKEEFIECLCDLFCNSYTDYSNFREMLYCKFGRGIAEKFLIPYNEKLYATSLDRLDTDAMGRFFPYADRNEIIANFRNSDNGSYNGTFDYPVTGAFEYIRSLLGHVDADRICTGERVLAVDTAAHTVTTDRRTLHYDNLISTIPFNRFLDLCGADYDRSLYTWNKVLVFNLGFDAKGADRRNNWVYFPDKELAFYRVGYYDNIVGGDRMSLYVELGFPKDAEIDVDYWRTRVLADLAKAGITRGEKLVAEHSVVMDPAYVHITRESAADVAARKAALAAANVYSIGRYGSWTYCSIEDGMQEAKAVAERTAGMVHL